MTPISPQKISSRRLNQRGLTLIEILLVMVIFAGLAVVGIPKLFKSGDNIRQATRKITSLTKEIRNRSKLKNATYRLVIDMTAEPHKYWVEYTPGSRPIPANLYAEKDEAPEVIQVQYKKDDLLMKEEKELPSGLFFGAVETINSKDPITQGMAYIHYFPEGFVEAAIIQLTNRKGTTWTLVISPLTGQAEILEEEKFLKDLTQ